MDSYTSMPISIEERKASFEFTSSEHQQVKSFLDKCHLSQYYATFIEEGFESLQAVSIFFFFFFFFFFVLLYSLKVSFFFCFRVPPSWMNFTLLFLF